MVFPCRMTNLIGQISIRPCASWDFIAGENRYCTLVNMAVSQNQDFFVDLPTSLALQCLCFPKSFTSWWVLGSWVEYLQNMHYTMLTKRQKAT